MPASPEIRRCTYAAFVEYLQLTCEDDEATPLVSEVLNTLVSYWDTDPTLLDLPRIKKASRLAEVLIDAIEETHPWAARFGYDYRPQNLAELVFGVLCQSLIDLETMVVTVEIHFPHLKASFDRERADYRTKYEQAKVEDHATGIAANWQIAEC